MTKPPRRWLVVALVLLSTAQVVSAQISAANTYYDLYHHDTTTATTESDKHDPMVLLSDETAACACHYNEPRFWNLLVYSASTVESLGRGFSLGFGARMLLYLFRPFGTSIDNGSGDLYEYFLPKAFDSVVSGISLATLIHGVSLFVPASVREQWMVSENTNNNDDDDDDGPYCYW